MATTTRAGGQIGRSLPRLEAREKVTGRAEYTYVMRLPGMLTGKIFRSTVAHGRIKSIDTSAAERVAGVHRVVTAQDIRKVIPDPYYGPAFHDQPILAEGKVRFVGEPVAVVLARDPHVAEAAAQEIVAQYEELPAVYDEVEAMTSGVTVHEELRPAGSFADLKHLKGRKNTNLALDARLRRGDADAAFAAAAHVFEHTFRTQKCLHLAFEPFASIADARNCAITIYTSSQGPSFLRSEIARLLRWPENRVRIKVPFVGGGYGSKLYIKLEALVAALSLLVRRPVKIALTMEEQFYQITKHPSTLRIKTGLTRDGRITARKCEVFWNGGAYADIGPRVTQKSGFVAAGPYDIENVAIDSYALYTNLTPAGALRGFGLPQLAFAYESHADMIARALGIEPVEFRRKNLLREGRPQASGTILRDAPVEAVLDHVCERMRWHAPFDRGNGVIQRGRGLAIALKAADQLGRRSHRVGRRQRHAPLRHGRHGARLRHGDGADGGRAAQRPGRDGQGRGARHRCHALRHGHARLTLAVSHGSCRAHRGRGSARQARGAGARGWRARGQQHPHFRAVQEKIRNAGRQYRRQRQLQAGLCAGRARNRLHAQYHAVLDGGRSWRRSRGRYSHRSRAGHT